MMTEFWRPARTGSARHFFDEKIDLPLFGELGQTSRDLTDIWSETLEYWDVWPNSPKRGKSILVGSKTREFVFWIRISRGAPRGHGDLDKIVLDTDKR